jgi:hypothetical protein
MSLGKQLVVLFFFIAMAAVTGEYVLWMTKSWRTGAATRMMMLRACFLFISSAFGYGLFGNWLIDLGRHGHPIGATVIFVCTFPWWLQATMKMTMVLLPDSVKPSEVSPSEGVPLTSGQRWSSRVVTSPALLEAMVWLVLIGLVVTVVVWVLLF